MVEEMKEEKKMEGKEEEEGEGKDEEQELDEREEEEEDVEEDKEGASTGSGTRSSGYPGGGSQFTHLYSSVSLPLCSMSHWFGTGGALGPPSSSRDCSSGAPAPHTHSVSLRPASR